jgi:transposase
MQTTEAGILYAGADLHGNNVFLSVIDGSGKEVFHRRVATTIDAVDQALEPYWPRIAALGVESTFNWYWLVDGLREQGREIKLGNPAKMDQYKGLKRADDRSDARWLAEQLRLGVFPACYIYPRQIRGVRDALRRRQMFVRQRTQSILSLDGLLARYGLEAPGVYALSRKWTLRDIEETSLEPFVQLQLRTLLESLRGSDRLAKEVENSVLAFLQPAEVLERIRQVPGVGPVLGMTIVLESGDFARFPDAGCYASYCRAVDSRRDSNGKKKGENNRRNGNPYLGWAFIEAAALSLRFEPKIQSWYDRKKRQRNSIVARKALACKLAKAAWHVMNGKDFDMQMLFG